MRLLEAMSRFFRRSWRVCFCLAFVYLLMTAFPVLLRDRIGIEGLKAIAVAPFVGALFGLLVASIARSDQRHYENKLRIDRLGLAGAVIGLFVGGYVGLIDRDGEFGWLGFENSSLVMGCLLGLFAGAVPMAVIGEVAFPSRTPNQKVDAVSSE